MCYSAAGSAALSPPVSVDRANTVAPLWAAMSVCVCHSLRPGCGR